MKSTRYFTAFALLLAACGARQDMVEAPGMVARWSTCSDSAGGSTDRTVLERSSWSGDRLVVDVRDSDFCGGTTVSGLGYAIDGDRLRIRWTWAPKQAPGGAPAPMTACKCDHALRFELSDLPRRDFSIELARDR